MYDGEPSEHSTWNPPWNGSHPTHTYTVETSWYSQPPGEMPFSGEAAAPGGLKTWEQVKFTSDSCAPRVFQSSKCLSGSEMGPSVCPAMTSCKRRPSNKREEQRVSHLMWRFRWGPPRLSWQGFHMNCKRMIARHSPKHGLLLMYKVTAPK